MELTHIHKNRTTPASLRAWFRQYLVAFINKHVDVFEALTRHSIQFGGNWLTGGQYPAKPERSRLNREQLTAIQQQLDELSQTVTLLGGQIDSGEWLAPTPAGATGRQSERANLLAAATNEIGINRFKALQAKP